MSTLKRTTLTVTLLLSALLLLAVVYLDRANAQSRPGKASAAGDEKTAAIIRPGARLDIWVTGTLPNCPIKGVYRVEPEGTVKLGPVYPRVRLEGMTMPQAEAALRDTLGQIIQRPQVSVTRHDSLAEPQQLSLERRVQELEEQVRALRITVEQLQQRKGR